MGERKSDVGPKIADPWDSGGPKPIKGGGPKVGGKSCGGSFECPRRNMKKKNRETSEDSSGVGKKVSEKNKRSNRTNGVRYYRRRATRKGGPGYEKYGILEDLLHVSEGQSGEHFARGRHWEILPQRQGRRGKRSLKKGGEKRREHRSSQRRKKGSKGWQKRRRNTIRETRGSSSPSCRYHKENHRGPLGEKSATHEGE